MIFNSIFELVMEVKKLSASPLDTLLNSTSEKLNISKMKNSLSYIIYVFKNRRKELLITGINLLFFIATLVNFLPTLYKDNSTKSLAKTLIAFSTITLIWDIILKIKKLRKSRTFISLLPKQINYSRIDNNKGFKLVSHKFLSEGQTCTNHIYYSQDINIYLQKSNDKKLNVEFCKAKQRKIETFIHENFEKLGMYLKSKYNYSNLNGKDFFNEVKLCLSEDVCINELVKCHRGMYYDSLLTNEIAGNYIIDRNGTTLADYSYLFPIKKSNKLDRSSIQSIKEAILNNHIGVSTIAITADNYMIFWIQNTRALYANNLIVPSGSGSCDFKDLTNMDFIRTLKTAMEREFMEESTNFKKLNEFSIKTKIIGHFRWMQKAGKPEFLGVTKIGLKWIDLVSNLNEVRKSNAAEKHVLEEEVHNIVEVAEVIKERLKKDSSLSVPLFCNMIFLLQYIEDNPQEAQDFIFK